MTIQADGMFSMPRTNSPISQIDPVDAPTRRRFLSHAAGGVVLVGASTVAATAVASHGGPAPGPDDAALLEMEELIFEHKEAAEAFNPEID
ncbi:hypothetical protein JQ597_35010 [Bradyrhizobium sp. AUGA SZCCT0177]|uniref:hypothetical protein n=1 Tax=Bradyrhizobium sp. AUGA SZCCT0177 TaxID=2807665 RepID=UPI001BA6E1BA|nr:hypothetical protein [Bradyrhizobium sp. AUGA SZCCT0177]MBR1287278.1 hypothetical protein [Bradyrhizobium sp. AUGA SZCCT0177]